MSVRSLIFWGILGALGVVGLTVVDGPDASVTTLEKTLGAEVTTSSL